LFVVFILRRFVFVAEDRDVMQFNAAMPAETQRARQNNWQEWRGSQQSF
jgi:hypothetical protein